MRSQGFDAPETILTDEYSVWVDIYRWVEPDPPQDDDGNPKPPTKSYYAQGAHADLQPRSGRERAAQSGTSYESTHVLYMEPVGEEIPAGAIVDVQREEDGPGVETYTVVFVAPWGTHLEIDLKREST